MQHLETCLPIAEADRISCRHLLMFLTVFFPVDVQNEIQLLSRFFCYSWFVYWVFGPEIRRLPDSSEIQFRMLSFSLFTLLDVKEGLKAQAVLTSLEGFLGAASLPVSSGFMSR